MHGRAVVLPEEPNGFALESWSAAFPNLATFVWTPPSRDGTTPSEYVDRCIFSNYADRLLSSWPRLTCFKGGKVVQDEDRGRRREWWARYRRRSVKLCGKEEGDDDGWLRGEWEDTCMRHDGGA